MTAQTDMKSLRSDARRNRERLVASARELFATVGVDVAVEEIVRHAGLGMGTLYRHFPAKDDLVDAVLEEAFGEILGFAEDAAAAEDGWEGLVGFFEQALALHAVNRGLKDALATSDHGRKRAEAMRARIRALLRRTIERAQEQGSLRQDFAVEDLPFVIWTAGRVIEKTGTVAPGYWRRYLGFVLDGLRADAATPLPGPPLTPAQLARATRRREA